jgi:hypothetical protein
MKHHPKLDPTTPNAVQRLISAFAIRAENKLVYPHFGSDRSSGGVKQPTELHKILRLAVQNSVICILS